MKILSSTGYQGSSTLLTLKGPGGSVGVFLR